MCLLSIENCNHLKIADIMKQRKGYVSDEEETLYILNKAMIYSVTRI